MNNGYALLIGVNDYSKYSHSLPAEEEGVVDLQGSLNDVSLWLELCLDLGFSPENIRVLTSPALPSRDLKGAKGGAATAAEIRAGVAWLAEALGAARRKDANAVGLMTYSGRGDQTDQGPVICPADTVAPGGGALENVVGLLEMQTEFARSGAAPGLTTVFDCSYWLGEPVGARVPLALRATGGLGPPIPAIGDWMFYAASTSAFQGQFAGDRWQGALTWAFMTTREQWTIVDQRGHKVITISYADMQKRTQSLLDALTINQRVGLHASADQGKSAWPLFGSGPGQTSVDPDIVTFANREQTDPNQYTIRAAMSQTSSIQSLGLMLASGPNPTFTVNGNHAVAETEYWFLSGTVLAQIVSNVGQSPYLQFLYSVRGFNPSYVTPAGETAYALISETPNWTQNLAPPQPSAGQVSLFFHGTSTYNGNPLAPVTLNTWVQLLVSGGTLLSVTWYIQTNLTPASDFTINPATATGNNFNLVASGPPSPPTYWGTTNTMTT